jgi:3-methyladenine DNA glycosylase AlkD
MFMARSTTTDDPTIVRQRRSPSRREGGRPTPSLEEALALIRRHARPGELAGMARFGIVGAGRLGLSVPDMRRIGKQLGRDHALALALWDTGIADARIVASLVCEPSALSSRQMDAWVRGIDSWDVCDQACLNAFRHSPLAWRKFAAWEPRRDEFVRRAAFSLLAVLAVHDRSADDARFIGALPLIEATAVDERNFVKKAVNWALRQIGKRNAHLKHAALALALRLRASASKSARWIGADAARELAARAD